MLISPKSVPDLPGPGFSLWLVLPWSMFKAEDFLCVCRVPRGGRFTLPGKEGWFWERCVHRGGGRRAAGSRQMLCFLPPSAADGLISEDFYQKQAKEKTCAVAFVPQSPKLSQEASSSFCFFSTSRLSREQHSAPSSSCFSWLPLEPPEPITLESRIHEALLLSNNNGDWVEDQHRSQASCKACVGCPADPAPARRPPATRPRNLSHPASLPCQRCGCHPHHSSWHPCSLDPPFHTHTHPQHDPSLLRISVFAKLRLKINFNYQN